MTDVLPFPSEAERLWMMINKKIEEQNFLAAKDLSLQLYQLEPTFQHCYKLIQTYQHLGEFQQALEYAEDYLEVFLNDEKNFTEYIHLLILAEQYLSAHRWLVATVFPTEGLKEELSQIEQAQQWINGNETFDKRQQLMRWEKSMRPIPQKEWQGCIKRLTRLDFITICKDYFKQATNLFILPKLVEELVKIGVTESFDIQGQTVDLSLLTSPEKMPFFMQARTYLQTMHLKDQQLEELVITELNAHVALMYPFLPAEEEAECWVDSYLQDYQEVFGGYEDTPTIDVAPKIQAKKQELRRIYQTLL